MLYPEEKIPLMANNLPYRRRISASVPRTQLINFNWDDMSFRMNVNLTISQGLKIQL